MKVANIAEFKNNLSKFLSLVEDSEVIEICKRNIPIAHLVPLGYKKKKTVPGSVVGEAALGFITI